MDDYYLDVETLEWRRRRRPEATSAVDVGVDPGKLSDPCAVVLYTREGGRRVMRQARRLPLGTRHDDVADRLARWAVNLGDQGRAITLFLDVTGVGEAVWELLQRRLVGGSVMLVPILLTGGEQGPTRQPKTGRVNVSKRYLVEQLLEPALNGRQVVAAAGCPDLEEVRRQLNAFRATYGEGGSVSYEAKSGQHDDLVLAAAYPLVFRLPPEDQDLRDLRLPRVNLDHRAEGDLAGLGMVGDGGEFVQRERDGLFADPLTRW